jgi:hypothetical protein
MVIFVRKVRRFHGFMLVWYVWLLRKCRTEEYDSLECYLFYLLLLCFCGDSIDHRIWKMTV